MTGAHTTFDVVVVGVGGMGSASLYHLARRGHKVLGLEQFTIPHEMGSSHGLTRIIRLAYFEHPSYVPLLRRAYALWHDLGQLAGEPVLRTTGSLDIGLPGGGLVEGSRQACELHGLPHEVLSGQDVRRRFPGYRLSDDALAVFQPDGGYLLAERCVAAHTAAAVRAGATVHTGERVLSWRTDAGSLRITTDRATYSAARLVLTAGAWMGKMAPVLADLAVPERQVVGWFQPTDPTLFTPEHFPVFNMRMPEGTFYGVPIAERAGLKIGRWHHLNERVDPDTIDRECTAADEAALRPCVARYFPEAAGPTLALNACMFTNSPDEHFIIDLHPDSPQVSIAAGFSGHGFKFCSVVGEVMADLALAGHTAHDIAMFRLDRFEAQRGAGTMPRATH
jgi:sarcosine oxidase